MEPERPEEPDGLTGWSAPRSPTGRRRRVVVAVAASAITALLVAGAIVRAQDDSSAPDRGGAANQGSSPSSSGPPSVNWPSPRSTPRPLPPEVISSRGFLDDLDVVVYARGADSAFRLDTRAGRITRTRGLDLESGAPASMLAGPDRVIVRSTEERATGFVVIDGQQPRPLTGTLVTGGAAHLGPRGRLWITTFPQNGTSTATLTDFTGRPVSSTLRIRGSGWFSSDGAGGLLYSGIGGTYRATLGGLRRLTSGAAIATGPRHYLTTECDARHVCSSYLHERQGQEKRRVASVYAEEMGTGRLSPDGRYAAWTRWDDTGSTVRVTDLRTNRTLGSFPLGVEYMTDEGPMVWLPDGRLLGVSEGRLLVFDPRRSRTTRPNLQLPPLIQVALRAG